VVKLEELKECLENAGPLFQLLLKFDRLQRPELAMAIIQILEGFLKEPSIGSSLRAAFVKDYLNLLMAREAATVPKCRFSSKFFILNF